MTVWPAASLLRIVARTPEPLPYAALLTCPRELSARRSIDSWNAGLKSFSPRAAAAMSWPVRLKVA